MGGARDVIVIGSGPNGLVAACTLARQGLSVLVLEAHPRRPGGALGSEPLTLPGFVHDVGAAFFPMRHSPGLRELALDSAGLRYALGTFETCHPALDGSYAAISRDPERTLAHFGSPEDAARLVELSRHYARLAARFDEALLGPPTLRSLLRLGPGALVRLLPVALSSAAGLAERWFRSEAARRVLPALGMHVCVAPRDTFGAALGYVLASNAATNGFAVPIGGAQSITNALVTVLERHGGDLWLASRVERVIVRARRAVAVRLTNGTEIEARRAIFADTSLQALFLDLVERGHLPSSVVQKASRAVAAPGTFKVDWALSAPVPWRAEPARASAVVHTGEDLDDLEARSLELRRGALSERPYLVVGQQSLLDASRAPPSQHTLYCYTRVPSVVAGGWSAHAERFADVATARIEGLAPGFGATVLARHVTTPLDFEAHNANLRGGDIGGGDNAWTNQLFFRPFWGGSRYATAIRGLYLCSSYAHPGAGVHGMCGYNAARRALRDLA